jgi:LysM repeat protein
MGNKKNIGLPGGPNEIIVDPKGQWNHPGKNTRIESNHITMQDVEYPVWAQPNVGPGTMMMPGDEDYIFKNAEYVDEYPMAQEGVELNKKYIDSTFNANMDKRWVQRLYEKNPEFYLEGQTDPSTHFMESGDSMVYPLVVEGDDGNLMFDRKQGRSQGIKFPTDEIAQWFAENYKDGTDVLKEKQRGGGLLDKTMECNSCGWEWKAADGGADVSTCHKCGSKALPKAQRGLIKGLLKQGAKALKNVSNKIDNITTSEPIINNAKKNLTQFINDPVNINNPFGFQRIGDTQPLSDLSLLTPENIDLTKGFGNYAEELSKLQRAYSIRHDSQNLSENYFEGMARLRDQTNKNITPFGKPLGSGMEGTVYEFANYPESVLKHAYNYSNKLSDINLPKEAMSFRDNATAIPLKGEKVFDNFNNTEGAISIMDNLNKVGLDSPLKLSKRNAYADLLKRIRKLRDSGIEIDANNKSNIRFNKDKGVYDIYDLQSGEGNPAYMKWIDQQLRSGKMIPDKGSQFDYMYGGDLSKAQDGLGVPDPSEQINFMKDWASSPMHRQMLNNSSGSDRYKEKITNIRSNFDDVKIGMFDDPGFLGLYHNGAIRMNPSLLNEEYEVGNGYDSVLTHELSHYTDDVNPSSSHFKGYNIPLSDQKLIKDYSKQGVKRAKVEEKELNELLKLEGVTPNDKDTIKKRVKRLKYLGSPTETRSRINATRYFYENDDLGRKQDSTLPSVFESEVTPDMIEIMKNSGQYKQLQELYTDDQILEMLNTISDTNNVDTAMNTVNAKYGIEVLPNAQKGAWIKTGLKALAKQFPSLAKFIDDAAVPAVKNATNKTDEVVEEMVEVVTGDGSIRKVPKSLAVRVNRVEDANVTNNSFKKYEDGNWFADKITPLYTKHTKNVMDPTNVSLYPDDPRRLFTAYFDPEDIKKFGLKDGLGTQRARSLSGGPGTQVHPNEYVIPPALVEFMRKTGTGPGFKTQILNQQNTFDNIFDFYKKHGGQVTIEDYINQTDLPQAQRGLIKSLIAQGAKKLDDVLGYADEFIDDAISNVYKYNPTAYNNINSKLPEFLQLNKNNEKWIRQVGKPAIDDAQTTRTVREIGETIDPKAFALKLAELKNAPLGQFQLNKRYNGPFFKKGETFFDYDKKSRSGLDGLRNTRGRSGSADFLMEFNPSDPTKYKGMDSYFQPAYMQVMQMDPKPFNKFVGDIGIMKPIMRDVDNFDFYKKDWLKGYKKTPLDELQPGGETGDYVVEDGDTFYGIANKNNISWKDLVSSNPSVDINRLSLGDTLQVPGYKAPVLPEEIAVKQNTYNAYAPTNELAAQRRADLDSALNTVVGASDNNMNLRTLLFMTGAMENNWGNAPDAYADKKTGKPRTYTRGMMSIDDNAYKDLFEPRGNNGRFVDNQKKMFEWLKGIGLDYTQMNDMLRSNDPLAGMAAARMQYARRPEPLPDGNDPDAVYEYYMKHYNRTGADHKERFMGNWNEFIKEKKKKTGGETIYNEYKKYVDSGFTGSKKSQENYDKLNRVHYRDAKSMGMSPANYIMTNILGSS